jgi:HTH-type transcriptional regulator/antitoxin HipB
MSVLTMPANAMKPAQKSGEANMVLFVEAFFGFMVKGAKRLLEISPEDLALLKKLGVTFMTSPETERPEIMQTMLEIALPDEQVGPLIDGERRFAPSTRRRVKASREYIGNQIRKYRESLGWTQIQLAKKARIPQSHVSRLEKGRLAPTHKTIARLAKVLRVSASQLDPGVPDEVEAA